MLGEGTLVLMVVNESISVEIGRKQEWQSEQRRRKAEEEKHVHHQGQVQYVYHTDTPGYDRKKLKGMSLEQVLESLQEDLTDDRSPEVERLWVYVDVFFNKLMLHKLFADVHEANMRLILKRESVVVEEKNLFRGLVLWGEAQARAKMAASPGQYEPTLKSIVTPMLPYIRFPTLHLVDFANIVVPTGLLPQDIALDLFRYLSVKETEMKEEGSSNIGFPLPQSLSMFSSVVRSLRPGLSSKKVTLPLVLLSTDGGEHSGNYSAHKLLLDDHQVHCTKIRRNANILCQLKSGKPFMVVGGRAKAPSRDFTAPIGAAMIFSLDNVNQVQATSGFDGWTESQFKEFCRKFPEARKTTDPVAFISFKNSKEVRWTAEWNARSSPIVLLKLIGPMNPDGDNIDVQYIVCEGYQ